MSRTCEICGRKTISGQNVPRKGLPKKKGGAGVHIGVRTKRKFRINLQFKSVERNGVKRKIRICTRCLRNYDKQYAVANL
jgi:large subunit ribosomal protein L28